jgi:uncharacterized repeat protein (TIGR03803 family)
MNLKTEPLICKHLSNATPTNAPSRARNLFCLRVLITGLGLFMTGWAEAQTFTTLYCFSPEGPFIQTNSDGAFSQAGLIISGCHLYGTAPNGGIYGSGTVFAIDANGTGFTTLHSFAYDSDGGQPVAPLLLSGNTLYGTASGGGTGGSGTIFVINCNGACFATLHNFAPMAWLTNHDGKDEFLTNGDGCGSRGGLILSGNTLYGTAQYGGIPGNGTIFAINTNGTGFAMLHTFAPGCDVICPEGGIEYVTNSDGAQPYGGLVLSGNTLYGTTLAGGTWAMGTIFAVNTDGTGFATLHIFTAPYTNSGGQITNCDGCNPCAGLILSGNTLYGTTGGGGCAGYGNVFAVGTNGSGFTVLHNFSAPVEETDGGPSTNSDGAYPGCLMLSGQTLYGVACYGGNGGQGTVFAVSTNGTGFTVWHNFTALSYPASANSDGSAPNGPLVLSGNTLYGSSFDGGTNATGTLFALALPQPKLTIVPCGSDVVLTWPTNSAGYSLQCTTNLSTANWSTLSHTPVLVNGQFAVTNSISGTEQFYRLSQ